MYYSDDKGESCVGLGQVYYTLPHERVVSSSYVAVVLFFWQTFVSIMILLLIFILSSLAEEC